MATQADVRRIAMKLAGTQEKPGHFAFEVLNKGKLKGYAWVWMERIDPKKARVPQPKVLAVRTASLDDKEFLLQLNPRKFFTEPHYNGYPAVLVRLEEVTVADLRPLLTEAWRTMLPREPATKKPARRKKSTARPKR